MKKKTGKILLWGSLAVAILAGIGIYGMDMLKERTIMPATDYEDAHAQTQKNSAAAISVAQDSTTPDSIRREATGVVMNTNNAEAGNTVAAEVVQGRQLRPSDFHINHKLNARLRFTNFLNTFREGDYVTGKDLAQVYGNDKEINSVVRKIVVKYFSENIDFIIRQKGELIINTVNQQPATTRIHVPLLIDVNLIINHGSKIVLGKTFASKEKNFKNVWMLPLNLIGIDIKQGSGSMPGNGYVSGDNYYVNYPATTDCYKLK